MLHEPDRHEALSPQPWQAERVQAGLQALVADVLAQRRDEAFWPPHPGDVSPDEPPTTRFKSLYLGSAGTLWALWWLQRQGAIAPTGIDFAAAMAQVDEAFVREGETGPAEDLVPSYFLGATGILLMRWLMTPGDPAHAAARAAVADRLHAAIEANIPNPTNEALWAAPGTMLAALPLWRATGEARWRLLLQANIDQLWVTWLKDEASGLWLWTQDMYGRQTQYLGAGHGFVGNVYALLACWELLDEARRQAVLERTGAVLQAMALEDDGAVNWPPLPVPAGSTTPGKRLMQWCHGAPGVVTALAGLPAGTSPLIDGLLARGAEAVWRAGPLNKLHGLCHGTAGNAYALLVQHQRSGEARWLARARAFLLHALQQAEQARATLGRGRYSLWSGDLGLAVALWHGLHPQGAGLPGLDVLE
jgi:hypothetical protein